MSLEHAFLQAIAGRERGRCSEGYVSTRTHANGGFESELLICSGKRRKDVSVSAHDSVWMISGEEERSQA